jgi:hypothetical protein
LHPRRGTPPNPGWFAPTDKLDNQPYATRLTENDHPISRSDAAQSVGENRVVLPPGQRNDELADLLEWIANAKPGDENGIRAEIKRNYYDAGDASGGDALNSALNNVLGPGTEHKDRQRILDAIGPFSFSSESDNQTVNLLIGAGLLLPAIFPPAAAADAASVVWELGWAARGMTISERFGANLPATFKTIDIFSDGIATSIKSTDLRTITYSNMPTLASTLDRYIGLMAKYDGGKLADIVISSSDIRGRSLNLVVPKGSMTAAQRAVIEAAGARAKALGVDFIISEF